MFLLDTNVVSEFRRPERADRNVLAWSASVSDDEVWLSVATVLELELGVRLMERRDTVQGGILRRWLDLEVIGRFEDRIIPIDVEIARRCAALHVPDPRPERDALIAATALVHGLTVVTRNAADFTPMGVTVLNPWQPQATPC